MLILPEPMAVLEEVPMKRVPLVTFQLPSMVAAAPPRSQRVPLPLLVMTCEALLPPTNV